MKKVIVLLLTLLSFGVKSQSTGWQPLALLPDSGRTFPFYFQIDDKFYMGGGFKNTQPSSLNSVWEFNPQTETWTKKNDFPGAPRGWTASFVYNSKGYVVGGASPDAGGGYYNEVWEYTPISDTWVQKGTTPTQMSNFYAGVIGDKAYIVKHPKLYEYNLINNTWIVKGDLPQNTRSQGFILNGKMYILTEGPVTNSGPTTNLYEYNEINDTWLMKNKPPFNVRDGRCIVVDQTAFVFGGESSQPGAFTRIFTKTGKKYNRVTDTWSEADTWTQYPGLSYRSAAGVVFYYNNAIYYGLGYYQNGNNVSEYYKTNLFIKTAYPVGVKELADEIKPSVYPNPADDKISIELKKASVLSIVSVLGNEIQRVEASEGKTEIDLSGLSTGVYFIRAGSQVIKFVKQ